MRRRLAVVVSAAVVALAGCSGDDGSTTSDDPATGEVVEVPGAVSIAGSVAFLPGVLRVAAPCDGSLCVWSMSDGALVDRYDGGGIVAAAGPGLYTDRVEDGTVELVLLDEASGEETAAVPAYPTADVQDGPSQGLRDIEASPDGTWVAAVGADGVVRRWTAGALTDERTFDTGSDVVALAWSPDASQLAVASSDGPVVVLDADTGEQVGELDAPAQGDVVWSEDGTHLATASYALDDDAATTVWDASTLEEVASLDRPGYRLAFADDSSLVMSVKDELDVLRWSWGSDDRAAYDGATDVPRAVLVAPGGSQVYAVTPGDGVLGWTSPDEPPVAFEKPGG